MLFIRIIRNYSRISLMVDIVSDLRTIIFLSFNIAPKNLKLEDISISSLITAHYEEMKESQWEVCERKKNPFVSLLKLDRHFSARE